MNFLTNKNYDVFISYSRKDYDAVKQFCSLLQHHNISYWIDKEKIDAELFKAKIIEGIDSSRIFLFFSSVSANRSQWTEKEIGYADKKKMTIIPVKLDNSAFSSNVQLDLVNRNSYNFTVKDKKLKTENTKGLLRALYKVKGLKEPYFFNEEQIDKFVEGEIGPGGGNPPPYWKKLLIVLVVVFLGIIGAFLYLKNKNAVYEEKVLTTIQDARKRFDNLRDHLWLQISDENAMSSQIEDGIDSILLLHDLFYQISLDSIQSEELKKRCLDEQLTYLTFRDSVKVFLLDKAEQFRAIERNTTANFYEESANKLK